MLIWWIFPLAFVASLLLTGLLRRTALIWGIADVPNHRSSHAVPTPRGGGAAIVLVFLVGLPLLGVHGLLPAPLLWALIGGGGLVALVGWLDDSGHVAAGWRLLAHFVASVWALTWLGGFPPVQLLNAPFLPGWLGFFFGLFYLIWLLNLYNFMDGIDGLAGVEALTVCMGAVLVTCWAVPEVDVWSVTLLLAAAVFGFLFWNFPKAKIFLGDTGSGFIGIVFGVLSLQSAWVSPGFFWVWCILLGAFVVDATVTLMTRLLRGERLYQAHRSHAYQHAARRAKSHVPVTLVFAGINLLWLFPLAMMVAMDKLEGFTGLMIAYVPLTAAAIFFKAGRQH